MSDEYNVGFWCHGEYHEVSIDLECLAQALKHYLASKPVKANKTPRIESSAS